MPPNFEQLDPPQNSWSQFTKREEIIKNKNNSKFMSLLQNLVKQMNLIN